MRRMRVSSVGIFHLYESISFRLCVKISYLPGQLSELQRSYPHSAGRDEKKRLPESLSSRKSSRTRTDGERYQDEARRRVAHLLSIPMISSDQQHVAILLRSLVDRPNCDVGFGDGFHSGVVDTRVTDLLGFRRL